MKAKPIEYNTIIYAQPTGAYYHLDRNCTMLTGGALGYKQITRVELLLRKLLPCSCAMGKGE